MEDFDFSELTDDQLLGLLRATLRECVARGDAMAAAARAAGIDEAERAKISREAAEREAAKLRAQERERIAKEAAEEVRRQREAQEAAAQRAANEERRRQAAAHQAEKARQAAEDAVRIAEEREAFRSGWLSRFAELVDEQPHDIHILRVNTSYRGWRVIVNKGTDCYTRDHLVDYYPSSATIHTTRKLMGRKKDLIKLCAEFWSIEPETEAEYHGSIYFPKETADG